LHTFDDLTGQFGGSVGRRRGSVIQFGCTMVAKRRRPPKIQQSDFVVKPVLNINMATDENQASMGHITTLDISLP
jgi:hypothetical protein